jgi:hypothetical protein
MLVKVLEVPVLSMMLAIIQTKLAQWEIPLCWKIKSSMQQKIVNYDELK